MKNIQRNYMNFNLELFYKQSHTILKLSDGIFSSFFFTFKKYYYLVFRNKCSYYQVKRDDIQVSQVVVKPLKNRSKILLVQKKIVK